MKMKERFPELGYLFSCYFHQDWTIEGSDWQGVVRSFIEHERPDIVEAATNQLGQFLAMRLDTERLEAALAELGNSYDPPRATSHEAWLHQLFHFLREHHPA